LINMNIQALTVEQKIYLAIATVLIVLFIITLGIVIYKFVYAKKKYREATYFKLSKLARDYDYLLYNNYKIDFDDSHVGIIDHILISKKYIYAINDFSISGVVKGELKSRNLTVIDDNQKVSHINNPLNYNINLVKRFNLFNNLDQSFVKGIVVINDDSVIKIENLNNQIMMIPRKKLCKVIKKFDRDNVRNFSEESIVRFMQKLDAANQ